MTREKEIVDIASTYAIDEVKDTCNPASKRGLRCAGFIDGAKWADEHPRQSGPTKYRAKQIGDGQWVEGWYVLHHFPITDSHNNVIDYEEVPMLFNDAPGVRDKGTYWHAIDPSTLEVIKEQLSLFEEL